MMSAIKPNQVHPIMYRKNRSWDRVRARYKELLRLLHTKELQNKPGINSIKRMNTELNRVCWYKTYHTNDPVAFSQNKTELFTNDVLKK